MTGNTYYPPLSPADTGMKGKCPRCGQGKLFSGFLTLNKECSVCGLEFDFADSGDGPAWFIMTGIGFIVATSAMLTEILVQPPYWVHAVIWLPLTLVLAIAPIRPLKGLMIARQYQTDAREGRLQDE